MFYKVTYDPNGATGGKPPEDGTNYIPTGQATVKGNENNLTLAGAAFAYWNTASDGTGKVCRPGSGSRSTATSGSTRSGTSRPACPTAGSPPTTPFPTTAPCGKPRLIPPGRSRLALTH